MLWGKAGHVMVVASFCVLKIQLNILLVLYLDGMLYSAHEV